MEDIKESEVTEFLPHRKDALQVQNAPFGKNAKRLAILAKKEFGGSSSDLAYKKDIDRKVKCLHPSFSLYLFNLLKTQKKKKKIGVVSSAIHLKFIEDESDYGQNNID